MLSSLGAICVLVNAVSAQTNSNVSTPSGSVTYDIERAPLPQDALGFSIGPLSVTEIIKSNLTAKLLGVLRDVSGAPFPIRIGGASSDKVIAQEDLPDPFYLDPEARDLDTLFISKKFFETWRDYFPENTPFTFTLNFANPESAWGNATLEAQWAIESLGEALHRFEFGDSPDHYAYLAYRNASTWNSTTYTTEFRALARSIVDADFYRNATTHPSFQAGGFADPPDLSDQQWEDDDLDIVNITKAGLEDSGLIDTYSVHLFPEADTPPIRKAKISLDLLSNHEVVYQNLSQFKVEAQAAASQDAQLVLSAAGSVAGGASGVSDTFGAALWGVDFVLTAASLGISRTFLHFDGYSPDSPIVPIDYQYRAQNLTAGVRANFYTSLFLAHVLRGPSQLSIGPLSDFNTSNLSAFALFDDKTQSGLQKLVFVDLHVYNTSSALWNPASQSRKNDSLQYVNDTRDASDIDVSTPWTPGTRLNVVRLEGPGTNARSGVSVAGQQVDASQMSLVGIPRNETIVVGSAGKLQIHLNHGEAVLVEKLAIQNRTSNATFIPQSHDEVTQTATTTRRPKKNKKDKKNLGNSLGLPGTAALLASIFAVLI